MASVAGLLGGTSNKSAPANSGALKRRDAEIAALKQSASNVRARAKDAGKAMISTAELGGAAFGTGIAYGYLGDKKMQVMGVDIPVAVGLGGSAYGLFQAMRGKDGGHIEALSNGVLAAGLSRAGARMGRAAAVAANKTPESLAGASRGGGRTREVNGRGRF